MVNPLIPVFSCIEYQFVTKYVIFMLANAMPWDCCVMRGLAHVFLYEKRSVFRVCYDQYLPDRYLT